MPSKSNPEQPESKENSSSTINVESIPLELRTKPHWVCWRKEYVKGKLTKVPYRPLSGKKASHSNPRHWCSFEIALQHAGKYDGIGFVFNNDYIGTDLDKAIDAAATKRLKPWAQAIFDRLPTYCEVSPSGTGVHLISYGRLPEGWTGTNQRRNDGDGSGVEIYSVKRYFTFTGQLWNGRPNTIEDCSAEIQQLYKEIQPAEDEPTAETPPPSDSSTFDIEERLAIAMRDDKFKKLFEGDYSDYPSQSEADSALCFKLAFYFERDAVRMDEIFRRSGLMRPKWERVGASLINRAIARCRETFGNRKDALLYFHHNDYGNAMRLIHEHGKDVRYCYDFKKWIVWDGERWAKDGAEEVKRLTQRVILRFLQQAVEATNQPAVTFAKKSLTNKLVKDAMAMAQPNLPVASDELDQHPYLLNFKNGTVDLRTGVLSPHDPKHFITKLVHFDYRPEAECPQFDAFLQTIMGRNDALVRFLQKALGYSLTGVTTEKAVFIPWGPGDNGKSTLLALFLFLVEEYATLLQIDTLMTKSTENSNTQTDLADLRGARFCMTSETEEGQRLAEGKLKRITQGMGKIKAIRKYENPIQFPETHKLWIDANHKPIIRGIDNAIWNRLHMIPFTVTIPKAEQDKLLLKKLKHEAEGILAWAVAGAVAWFKNGLEKPQLIVEAVSDWRKDAEPLREFIAEKCCVDGCGNEAHKSHECLRSDLRIAYVNWCKEHDRRTVDPETFNNHLESLGMKRFRDKPKGQKDRYLWKGISLLF